jgi:hypothetical protein
MLQKQKHHSWWVWQAVATFNTIGAVAVFSAH